MDKHQSQAYLPGFEQFDLFGDLDDAATDACVHSSVAPLLTNPGVIDMAAPTPVEASDVAVAVAISEEAIAAADEGDAFAPASASATVHADAGQEDLDPSAEAINTGERLLSDLPGDDQAPTISRATSPWPTIDASAAESQGVDGKFAANLRAIEVLNSVAAESRDLSADERKALNAYCGWGPVAQVFTSDYRWRDRQQQLRDALGNDRFEAASDAVNSSFYTPVWLIKAIWSLIQRLGFTGGRVLDPSAGPGNFFGSMPQELLLTTDMHAVEIDPLSAQICSALYGNAARITNSGFEAAHYPEEFFDLAVSNVPFGDFRVPCGARKAYSRWTIHNYFVARMLDLVRAGGLVIAITSSYVMDSSNSEIRNYLHRRAKLLGAIRLPQGTFKASAETEVGADLLVFQKRHAWEIPEADEAPWIELKSFDNVATHLDERLRKANEYFVNSPEAGAGTWASVRGQYGERIGVLQDGNVQQAVMQRLTGFPEGIFTAAEHAPAQVGRSKGAHEHVAGSYVFKGGEVFQSDGYELQKQSLNGTASRRVIGMIGVRDILKELLQKQSDRTAAAGEVDQLRKRLNIRYDAFVASHGALRQSANARVFRDDPAWPMLLSLEVWDDETQTASKADVFHRNTGAVASPPASAECFADAVAISIAELGKVDMDYIARLLGRDGVDKAEFIQELERDGSGFEDPVTRKVIGAAEYLSGNVREKLKDATAGGERYARHIAALTSVLPEDLTPGQIEVQLGALWVPAEDYEAFIRSLTPAAFGYYSTLTVEADPKTAAWSIDLQRVGADFNTQWSTDRHDATELLTATFNGRSVTSYDYTMVDGKERATVNIESTAAARERQALMQQAFSDWIWSDEDRAKRLARKYNDLFNSWVDRQYDGSRMRLPGYSWFLQPSAHQLNGAARAATGDNTLLGHVVGAGKSLTMQIASMEMRRLGIRNKPTHVIPNHMLEQYVSEFLRAYPAAKLLMISKEDLRADRRKLFTAKVALGDWDAVVMTHAVFEKIAPPPKLTEHVVKSILSELEAQIKSTPNGAANRTILKMAKKAKKDWEAKLETLAARWKRDDFLSIDQLGIDHVLVDEGHFFKNLARISQMERVAGLSDSSSQRAFDMFVKTRAIMALHGGRQSGVTFATGTFVANSIAEMHVMQRYLQPRTLEKAGLESFDAWARMFGRVVTSLEVSPDGGSFRMNRRFAQFVNVPELMAMFGEVADIKTRSMLKLPTPAVAGGGAQVIAAPASDLLKEFVASLVKRAEDIRQRAVDPKDDNMLKVTSDGRKAALDIRMVLPDAAFDTQGKVAAMVNKAHQLWAESASFRGAQAIFCDMGTPVGADLNLTHPAD